MSLVEGDFIEEVSPDSRNRQPPHLRLNLNGARKHDAPNNIAGWIIGCRPRFRFHDLSDPLALATPF